MATVKTTITKKEMCEHYDGISPETLRRWMKPFIPELVKKFRYKKTQRIFTPAQANFLFEKFG